MKEYNKGDKVWVAKFCNEQVKELCPCCYGKCRVTLILGNDEQVVLPCDYCSRGYEAPVGYSMEYQRISAVEEQTIYTKNATETDGVRECNYRTLSDDFWYAEDVFDNKEDAEKRLALKIKEYDESQASSKSHKKQYANKKYSWNAGYHRKCAEKAEKDMLYHREKCKSVMVKVKEKVDKE